MTQSPESVRLTAQFQLAQRALGRQVQAAVGRVWRTLDMTDIDAGWGRVSVVIGHLIAAGHGRSAAQAAVYLTRHGLLNDAETAPTLANPLPSEQVATALSVTGPTALKRATVNLKGVAPASRVALVQLAGASQRLALAGSRDTITATVHGSDHLVGWQRVGEGRCQFCADLIAQGPMYGADASVFAAHDHDSCIPEPVYE